MNSHRSAGAANGVYPAGALDWSVKRRESPADESFDDIEEAQDLCHRVNGRKEINEVHWTRTYPEYGSPAWEDEEWDRRARLHDALSRGDSEEIDRWS